LARRGPPLQSTSVREGFGAAALTLRHAIRRDAILGPKRANDASAMGHELVNAVTLWSEEQLGETGQFVNNRRYHSRL